MEIIGGALLRRERRTGRWTTWAHALQLVAGAEADAAFAPLSLAARAFVPGEGDAWLDTREEVAAVHLRAPSAAALAARLPAVHRAIALQGLVLLDRPARWTAVDGGFDVVAPVAVASAVRARGHCLARSALLSRGAGGCGHHAR